MERYSAFLKEMEEKKKKIADETGFTVEQLEHLGGSQVQTQVYLHRGRSGWHAFISEQWSTVLDGEAHPVSTTTEEDKYVQAKANTARMRRLGELYRELDDDEKRVYTRKAEEYNARIGMKGYNGDMSEKRGILTSKMLNQLALQLGSLQSVAGLESFVVFGRPHGSRGFLREKPDVMGSEMGIAFWRYCEKHFDGMQYGSLEDKFHTYCMTQCPDSGIYWCSK